MPTPIETSGIVATAFELLEQSPPSTLADGSQKAEAANRAYPRALDKALIRAPWSFATRLEELPPVDIAATGLTGDDELPYAFTLPADHVKIWQVYPSRARWRIDEIHIRTDQPAPLKIRYTFRLDNEGRASQAFQVLVAYEMALLLSPTYNTSASKRAELRGDHEQAFREALRADAHSASSERYDDTFGQPVDWVEEALR